MLAQVSAGTAEPYGSTNKSTSFHTAASFNSAMPAKTTSRSSSAFSSTSRETGWLPTVGKPSCQKTTVLASSAEPQASSRRNSNATLRMNASRESKCIFLFVLHSARSCALLFRSQHRGASFIGGTLEGQAISPIGMPGKLWPSRTRLRIPLCASPLRQQESQRARGGAHLKHEDDFGWPILAGLVYARVGSWVILRSKLTTQN